FPPADFVNGRDAFGNIREVVFPDGLAIVLIVSAQLAIRRCGDENQPAGGNDNSASRELASGVRIRKPGNRAVGHLPQNLTGIQIVRGELRPGWADDGKAKARSHEELVRSRVT